MMEKDSKYKNIMTTLLTGCKKQIIDYQVIQQNVIQVKMFIEKVNYKSSIKKIKFKIINTGNVLVTFGDDY